VSFKIKRHAGDDVLVTELIFNRQIGLSTFVARIVFFFFKKKIKEGKGGNQLEELLYLR